MRDHEPVQEKGSSWLTSFSVPGHGVSLLLTVAHCSYFTKQAPLVINLQMTVITFNLQHLFTPKCLQSHTHTKFLRQSLFKFPSLFFFWSKSDPKPDIELRFLSFSYFFCIYVHVCGGVDTHVCACVCMETSSQLWVLFVRRHLLCFLRQVLSRGPGTYKARATGQ
jgi:hypothetical protein